MPWSSSAYVLRGQQWRKRSTGAVAAIAIRPARKRSAFPLQTRVPGSKKRKPSAPPHRLRCWQRNSKSLAASMRERRFVVLKLRPKRQPQPPKRLTKTSQTVRLRPTKTAKKIRKRQQRHCNKPKNPSSINPKSRNRLPPPFRRRKNQNRNPSGRSAAQYPPFTRQRIRAEKPGRLRAPLPQWPGGCGIFATTFPGFPQIPG